MKNIPLMTFKSTEIATYDTLGDLYALLTALSKGDGNLELGRLLSEWSFITRWNSLNQFQRMKQLIANLYFQQRSLFIHELNLFLFIKDKEFFNKTAKPMIESKLRKDMMDYFFLNDRKNLKQYKQQPLL